MTTRTSKKLKVTELFLSLGLVATLATSCGGPAEEGGEAIEGDTTTTEEPAEGGEGGEAEEPAEGGEGGEG